jgi:hypothetical protein
MIPLFISVVSLLPAWINFGPAVPWEGGLWQYILTSLAYGMFFLTLFFLLIIIAGGLWFSAFTVLPRLNLSLWSRWLAFFSTVISFLMFVWACHALYQVVTNIKTSPLEAFFFFLRTIELGSGVSLLLPWVFIWLAAFLFFFSIVRRLDLAERACDLALHFATPLCVSLTAREGQARSSFTGLTELEDRVKDLLTCSIFTVPGASLMIVFIGAPYLHRFVAHRIPSLEGEWLDLFFWMAFYVVPLWLAWVFLQLFSLALRLRRFLQRLGWHPLFNAPIDVQDPAFQMLPKLSLMSSMPTDAALSSSLTLAQEFLRLLNKAAEHQGFSVWPIPCMKTLWSEVEQAERQLQQALDHEAHRRWREALAPRRAAQKAMSKASRAIAARMEPHWTALQDQS